MAESIGEVGVKVVADFADFAKDTASKIVSPMEKAASKGGQALVEGFGAVTRVGFATVGTLAAAGFATAMTKGFSRLEAIDSATGKMQGMADSMKAVGLEGFNVEDAMNAAKEAVDGTAFGLDEAATQMANFVGTSGDIAQSTKLLDAMVQTASGASLPLGELTDVFSDLAAQGHVTTETLQRMQARGIDATSAFAGSMGISIEEFNDKLKKGEVSIDDFTNAMQYKFGAAGDVANKTFSGSLANMKASLGRLGASLMQPIFEKMPDLFNGIREAANKFGLVLQPLAAKLGDLLVPALEWLVEAISKLDFQAMLDGFNKWRDGFDSAGGAISIILPLIGTFAGSLAPLLQHVPLLGDMFGKLFGGLGPLSGGLLGLAGAFVAANPDAFMQIMQTLWDVIEPLLPLVGELVGAFADFASEMTSGIMPAIADMVDVIAPLVAGPLAAFLTWATDNIDVLVPLAGAIAGIAIAFEGWKAISTAVDSVKLVAGGAATMQEAMELAGTKGAASLKLSTAALKLQSAATKVWSAVTTVATGVAKLFRAAMAGALGPIGIIITVIAALVGALIWFFTQTELGRTIWANFTKFLSEAWANISAIAMAVFEGLASFFGGIWESISSTATSIWQGIVDFFTTIWNSIVTVWTTVWDAVANFLAPIFAVIGAIIGVAIDVIVNIFRIQLAIVVTIWQWVSDAIMTVWNAISAFLTPIITAIVTFITDTFNNFVLGWQIIWGIISDVITTVWTAIVDFITPIIDAIVSFITDTFNTVATWWTDLWTTIGAFIAEVWNAIVGFIAPIVQSVVNAIKGPIDAILGWWNGIWTSVSNALSSAWEGMISAVTGFVDRVVRGVKKVKDDVVNFFDGAINWLKDAGQNIIQGLVNGIQNMVGDVLDAIGNVADQAIDWANSVLGIKSPSTVFKKMGTFVGEGLAIGIASTADAVAQASADMATGAIDSANGILDGGLNVPAVSGSGSAAAFSGTGAPMTPSQASQFAPAGSPISVNVIGDMHPERTARAVADTLAEKVAVIAA